MRLLAFVGPLKCVCRVVTAFFLLAFLIFPAAAEPALPPISGSNGLMGLWGANNSASQTGSSGKPISGSNTGHHCSWHSDRVESTERGCRGCRAQVESTGCRARVSPPSAPRNVAPSPSAQSGSNGLIEWSANNSASQTGSSGKPISGSKQGTTAPGTPTELSPPSADAEDAELKSAGSSESTKRATKCRAQCSIRFQWTDRVGRKHRRRAQVKAISGSKQGTMPPGTPTDRVHRARMQRMQSSSRFPGCGRSAQSGSRTDRVERKQLGIADGLKH